MADAAAPAPYRLSSPLPPNGRFPTPRILLFLFSLFLPTTMEDTGSDVGDGDANLPTAMSCCSVAGAPSFSGRKGVVFVQRSPRIVPIMGGQGGFSFSASSSLDSHHVLPAPPPIFAGCSPWSIEAAELGDHRGLPHQLDAAPRFSLPMVFEPHRTMPPGPPDRLATTSLVNTVLWNPGALGASAGAAARFAALQAVPSRHWQDLLATADVDCVAKTLDAVLWFVFELMGHEVGRHLFQKLVTACGEAQLRRVVSAVAESPWDLVALAKRRNGRKCVEKLLLAARRQRRTLPQLMKALSVGVVELMTDVYGRQVVETCLTRLNAEHNMFIYAAALINLKNIARHKYGSPSLSMCIEHAPNPLRGLLVDAVISTSASLSQDQCGNYVVQRVIQLEDEEYTGRLLEALSGHCVHLAMHKNGSHVVESCVKSPAARRRITEALVSSRKLDQIARDAYGNYVVQKVLNVLKFSEPALHREVVRSLMPHLQSLRCHPHGKKVHELLTAGTGSPPT